MKNYDCMLMWKLSRRKTKLAESISKYYKHLQEPIYMWIYEFSILALAIYDWSDDQIQTWIENKKFMKEPISKQSIQDDDDDGDDIFIWVFLAMFSEIWARDSKLHRTIVSAKLHVSSFVFPAGISTTYDSITTVPFSPGEAWSVVTDR